MIKIRLRFSKGGKLRFIGHLDFLKVFQQALGRSKLPVAYSQGFNPHMQLSFALPLPLGMTSIYDYADLTLDTSVPEDEIISRLNAHAPQGLTVTGAKEFSGPGAAALAMAADYILPVKLITDSVYLVRQPVDNALPVGEPLGSSLPIEAPPGQAPEEIITSILSRESIVIPKKTKSGIKDTDIRPDILGILIKDNNILMRLAAGSSRFLNPLIVAGLLIGQDACPSHITRAELYRNATASDNNVGLVSLFDIGLIT